MSTSRYSHDQARNTLMRVIVVERDVRGPSETYTAYTLVSRDMEGRIVWTEGVQRDWCARMWPQWRAVVSPQIRRLCREEK